MAARGEQTIQAGDREVPLLFTNRALAGAEKELGKGIVAVLQNFEDGASVSDVAILLRHGMEAARRDARTGGRPVSMLDAYDVLDEAGFAATMMAVVEGVAAVLQYDPEDVAGQNGQGPNE